MNQADFYSRLVRPLVLFAGLAAYVLFTVGLLRAGLLDTSAGSLAVLLPVWVLGCVVLVTLPGYFSRLHGAPLVLSRAFWFNLGAVFLALLVPGPTRMIMLVVPLFSVVYAAIYLMRGQVLAVALGTALLYAALAGFRLVTTSADPLFELLSALAFGVMLSGVLLLSAEMHRLRENLVERNRGLREAMERLQELALRDELTGLHNRRFIMEVLTRQKALADRGQHGFTLCYCDLDHFKQVNDKFGHATGDQVLRAFADNAEAVVRNVDYVARFGGEEFLLVVVEADETTAATVAQRLAERTRQMQMPGTDEPFRLTVSVGVTRYRSGESIDDLLSRADTALYQAKSLGRDKVVIAPEPSVRPVRVELP